MQPLSNTLRIYSCISQNADLSDTVIAHSTVSLFKNTQRAQTELKLNPSSTYMSHFLATCDRICKLSKAESHNTMRMGSDGLQTATDSCV